MYHYEFPRPAVSTDIIVVSRHQQPWQVLLIERAHDPFKSMWALPGGFVDQDEDLLDCAHRELAEETGLTGLELEQFRAFGKPGRDPRGHNVTITFIAIADATTLSPAAGSDAARARWFAIDGLPPLAFDHKEIIARAHRHLTQTTT